MLGVKKNLTGREKPAYQMIDSVTGLKAAVAVLMKKKIMAVDVEADSMYHFKEKVCLIQISSERVNLLIDPLSIRDLSPLTPLFSNRKIKKIFHGADYDVRSLYRDFKIEINNLFDTQIASMFLGSKEISLHAVVQRMFHIALDKKYQKKDWSQRPLPKEMTDYAIHDVLYLIPLAKLLEKKLKKKKRLEWVKEECDTLSKVRPVLRSNKPLFYGFKGAGRLDPRSLCVLEAILQFRKKIAKQKDRPLFRIFSNDAAMKMARDKPTSLRSLKQGRIFSAKQVDMYGDPLVQAIAGAIKKKKSDLPMYPRKKSTPISSNISKRINALKAWRDKRSEELALEPALLFNKAMLTAIAKKNPQYVRELKAIDGLKNWQKAFLGKDIITVLKKCNQKR